MAGIKVIITGATGMVGEGVLLECLNNEKVAEVLMINRRHFDLQHPKLKELIVKDFLQLGEVSSQLQGYDACFFCAGVSSVGMKEDKYRFLTYDTTLSFANAIFHVNPQMIFTYVSGAQTDADGRMMWARVKGKTEQDLMALGFKAVYNFRPGLMTPYDGQQNWSSFYKIIGKIAGVFSSSVLPMKVVGHAMINAVTMGFSKHILEVKDIKELANKES